MGSGKTTLWKKLIQESGKSGFDFDHEIARRLGKTPELLGECIDEMGWEKFRALEVELLKETLSKFEEGLFALGGGTLSSNLAKELIDKNRVKVYWLNTPVEKCWERIKDESHRPLVKNGKESFFKLYNERLELYQNFEQYSSLAKIK